MKNRICIVSFSPILRDARVLRQIEYLSPYYDLTVIGYGEPDQQWQNVTWIPVATNGTLLSRILDIILLLLGRVWHGFYDIWYWNRVRNKQAFQAVLRSNAEAIHANDLYTLPLAIKAGQKTGVKIVFDAHEYSPLELENYWWWRLLFAPMKVYFLKKFTPFIQASITVCQPIAKRYKEEFNFEPIVVLNAPKLEIIRGVSSIDPNNIRLIHHGSAMRDRRLEIMIRAISLTQPRFSLHFMLTGNPTYVEELKSLANRIAGDRVVFHAPVDASQVIETISQFDIGFYLLAPSSYNNLVALPNKFFDFLNAGLAVCIGPSPTMAQIVQEYKWGLIAPSFDAADVAKTLNNLMPEQIAQMRQASRQAALTFNADNEMAKVIDLYHHLLDK